MIDGAGSNWHGRFIQTQPVPPASLPSCHPGPRSGTHTDTASLNGLPRQFRQDPRGAEQRANHDHIAPEADSRRQRPPPHIDHFHHLARPSQGLSDSEPLHVDSSHQHVIPSAHTCHPERSRGIKAARWPAPRHSTSRDKTKHCHAEADFGPVTAVCCTCPLMQMGYSL